MTRWRAAWAVLLAIPASFEVWTLVNASPNDTLSAQVWALLDAHPILGIPLALFLAWLTAHWLGRKV